MKKYKLSIISIMILLAVVLCLLSGCAFDGGNESSAPMPESDETVSHEDSQETIIKNRSYNITKDSQNIRFIGRMQDVDGGVFCDFTASGIEFKGTFEGEIKLHLSCNADTYFSVYIDEVESADRYFANSGTEYITVATFETAETHTVKILKQTEAQVSLSVLKSIEINGILDEAPAKRDHLIEFIGDSITSGYGNLGDNSTKDAGSALWSDGTQAYAFLTAELLDADATIISCSGIGLDKGYTDFCEADFYLKQSYYRNADAEYTDNGNVPDLVVINLGTNDLNCGSGEQAFKQGASDLITDVRDFYGTDVKIVWVYGMMGTARFEWTKEVLEGFENVYYISLPQNSQGGNMHPNVEAHRQAAELLAEFITNDVLSD